MSVFDTLAENRYQQWLEASRQPGYRAPEPVTATRRRLSFEGMLYQRVLALLSQAGEATDGDNRQALLEAAARAELQLIVALEKKGLPRVVQTLRESIRQHRAAVDAGAARDPAQSTSMQPDGGPLIPGR